MSQSSWLKAELSKKPIIKQPERHLTFSGLQVVVSQKTGRYTATTVITSYSRQRLRSGSYIISARDGNKGRNVTLQSGRISELSPHKSTEMSILDSSRSKEVFLLTPGKRNNIDKIFSGD
jgi:lysophospholipid acyltransferase (LPLAT)-like uncharacterized protein